MVVAAVGTVDWLLSVGGRAEGEMRGERGGKGWEAGWSVTVRMGGGQGETGLTVAAR